MKWQYGTPTKTGNYFVYWDTSASRKYPNICSKYDVLHWAGEWFAPVNDENPILAYAELPEKPILKDRNALVERMK